MGTEAIWVPLVLSAVSAGASAKNTYDTAKRQDNEMAAGIAAQADRQRQADQRVSQEVQAIENSSPEAERAAAQDQFLTQLRQSRAQQGGDARVGATSNEFNKDAAQSESNVVDFGKATATRLARIAAPGRQRTNEQVSFGRLGSDLGTIGRNSQADAFLSQLRARGIQRNPWIDAAAGVGQGVAGGMAQNTGYSGGDSTVTLDNGYQFTNRQPKLTMHGRY